MVDAHYTACFSAADQDALLLQTTSLEALQEGRRACSSSLKRETSRLQRPCRKVTPSGCARAWCCLIQGIPRRSVAEMAVVHSRVTVMAVATATPHAHAAMCFVWVSA